MASASRLVATEQPRTGCAVRMRNLPWVKWSDPGQVVKDDHEDTEYGPAANTRSDHILASQDGATEGTTRRCVYNYEDKYRFSRILTSDMLVFDSHFESGNLESAHRVVSNPSSAAAVATNMAHGVASAFDQQGRFQEYDLFLHKDLQTYGHTQWFYFAVSNTVAGMRARFNICNMAKPDSMFRKGMRPLMISQTDAAAGRGWRRCGTNIRYYCNEVGSRRRTKKKRRSSATGSGYSSAGSVRSASKPSSGGAVSRQGKSTTSGRQNDKKQGDSETQPAAPTPKKLVYTLTFTVTFEHTGDKCYFAYCHPYTYTELQRFLFKLQRHPVRRHTFRRSLLCHTLARNRCDLLTITAPADSPEQVNARPVVILTARVHPGETPASWIMHGALDFLTSDDPVAEELRHIYVFKVVPMLNPDGVTNGHTRTSLAGVDLNRRWANPDPVLHPTIVHTKAMVERLLATGRNVALVIDLHGHSRKEGLFTYGCLPDLGMLAELRPDGLRQALRNRYGIKHAYRCASTALASRRPTTPPSGNESDHDSIVGRSGGQSDGVGQSAQTTSGQHSAATSATLLASSASSTGLPLPSNTVLVTPMDTAMPEFPVPPRSNPVPAAGARKQQLIQEKEEGGQEQEGNMRSSGVASTAAVDTPRGFRGWSVRILPRLLDRHCDIFTLNHSHLNVQRAKFSTMRIVMFRLGIDCAYTIEASVSGNGGEHFSRSGLMQAGRDICLALRDYFPVTVSSTPSEACKHAQDIHNNDVSHPISSSSDSDDQDSGHLVDGHESDEPGYDESDADPVAGGIEDQQLALRNGAATRQPLLAISVPANEDTDDDSAADGGGCGGMVNFDEEDEADSQKNTPGRANVGAPQPRQLSATVEAQNGLTGDDLEPDVCATPETFAHKRALRQRRRSRRELARQRREQRTFLSTRARVLALRRGVPTQMHPELEQIVREESENWEAYLLEQRGNGTDRMSGSSTPVTSGPRGFSSSAPRKTDIGATRAGTGDSRGPTRRGKAAKGRALAAANAGARQQAGKRRSKSGATADDSDVDSDEMSVDNMDTNDLLQSLQHSGLEQCAVRVTNLAISPEIPPPSAAANVTAVRAAGGGAVKGSALRRRTTGTRPGPVPIPEVPEPAEDLISKVLAASSSSSSSSSCTSSEPTTPAPALTTKQGKGAKSQAQQQQLVQQQRQQQQKQPPQVPPHVLHRAKRQSAVRRRQGSQHSVAVKTLDIEGSAAHVPTLTVDGAAHNGTGRQQPPTQQQDQRWQGNPFGRRAALHMEDEPVQVQVQVAPPPPRPATSANPQAQAYHTHRAVPPPHQPHAHAQAAQARDESGLLPPNSDHDTEDAAIVSANDRIGSTANDEHESAGQSFPPRRQWVRAGSRGDDALRALLATSAAATATATASETTSNAPHQQFHQQPPPPQDGAAQNHKTELGVSGHGRQTGGRTGRAHDVLPRDHPSRFMAAAAAGAPLNLGGPSAVAVAAGAAALDLKSGLTDPHLHSAGPDWTSAGLQLAAARAHTTDDTEHSVRLGGGQAQVSTAGRSVSPIARPAWHGAKRGSAGGAAVSIPFRHNPVAVGSAASETHSLLPHEPIATLPTKH